MKYTYVSALAASCDSFFDDVAGLCYVTCNAYLYYNSDIENVSL